MSRTLSRTTGTLLIAAIVIILLLWRVLLYLYNPFDSPDGVWYLSQTYSLLRGDLLSSPFGYSYLNPYLLLYMYSILAAPFFALFGHMPVSLILWTVFLLAGMAAMVIYLSDRYERKEFLVRLILALIFVGSNVMYVSRPEALTIFLMLVMLYIVAPIRRDNPGSTLRTILAGTVAALIGLVHPVGGVFAVVMLVLTGVSRRLPMRYFIFSIGITTVLVAVLYGPVVLVDPQEWFQQFFVNFAENEGRGSIRPAIFVQYSLFAIFMYVPFILMFIGWIAESLWRRVFLELATFAMMIILLLPFTSPLYYPYLSVYIVWRILENGIPFAQAGLGRLVLLGSAVGMPFFSHYLPTMLHIENPAYAVQSRAIVTFIESAFLDHGAGLIWVQGEVGIHAISSPNARLYSSNISRLSGAPISLQSEDVIYIISDRDLRTVNGNLDIPPNALQITSLISPPR